MSKIVWRKTEKILLNPTPRNQWVDDDDDGGGD